MRSQIKQASCNNTNNNLFSKVQQLSFQSSFFTSISDFQKWIVSQVSKNTMKLDDGIHQIASKLQKCSTEIIQYLNYSSPTSQRLDSETRFAIYSTSFSMISERYEIGKAAQILKQIMLLSPASSSSFSYSQQVFSPSNDTDDSSKLQEPSIFQSINVEKNIICPMIQFILLLLQEVYSFVLKGEVDSSKWEILNSKLHALSIIFRQMIEPVVSNSQFDGELIHNSLFYLLKESILVPLCQNEVLLYQEKKDWGSPTQKAGSVYQMQEEEVEEVINSPQLSQSQNVKKICVSNTIGRSGLFKLNQWNQLWQILDLDESDFTFLLKELEGDSKILLQKTSSSLVNEEGTQIAREISTQTPSDSTSPLFMRGVNTLRREKSSNSCMLTSRKSSNGILSQPAIGGSEEQSKNFFSSQGPIMSSFESIPQLCLSFSQTSNSEIISQRDAWYDSLNEDLKGFELKPMKNESKLKKGKSKSSPAKEKNNNEIKQMLTMLKNKRKLQEKSRKAQAKDKIEQKVEKMSLSNRQPKEYLTPIRKKYNKRNLKTNILEDQQQFEQDTFFEGKAPIFSKQTVQQGEFLVSKYKSPGRVLEVPDTPESRKKKRFMGFNKSNFRTLF